jgi:hypothetical protein
VAFFVRHFDWKTKHSQRAMLVALQRFDSS